MTADAVTQDGTARILADGCEKFRIFSVEGTALNETRIGEFVQKSLMLVTALSPVIGYDKASKIAHKALDEGTTLKQAALAKPDVGACYSLAHRMISSR